MAKHLTITYGDVTLYDDVPEHFKWEESNGSITIVAGAPPVNPLGQFMQKAMAGKGKDAGAEYRKRLDASVAQNGTE
jgi:hypothetical protein